MPEGTKVFVQVGLMDLMRTDTIVAHAGESIRSGIAFEYGFGQRYADVAKSQEQELVCGIVGR